LYFDSGWLCLMVTDGKPVIRSRWAVLGGKLWMGDISPDKNGRRVQDVKVTGIPLKNARLAIRLVRAPQVMGRPVSEATRLALAKGRLASPIFQKRAQGRNASAGPIAGV
jgi:hypothetical protein